MACLFRGAVDERMDGAEDSSTGGRNMQDTADLFVVQEGMPKNEGIAETKGLPVTKRMYDVYSRVDIGQEVADRFSGA